MLFAQISGTETVLQLVTHAMTSQRAQRPEPGLGSAPSGTVCGCDLFLRFAAVTAAASRGRQTAVSECLLCLEAAAVFPGRLLSNSTLWKQLTTEKCKKRREECRPIGRADSEFPSVEQ